MLDSYGTLSVRAYSAGGALPVSDAVVRIFGAEEDNRLVSYSLLTDSDGVTPPVQLPTRSRALSLTPEPSEIPYSVYDIEISADGYIEKRISGIPIFPGVYSLQPINMIPHTNGSVPKGGTDSAIPESDLI